MKVNINDLIRINTTRWNACVVTQHLVQVLDETSHRLCSAAAKMHYDAVSKETGVPWFIIAVIHEREASQSWRANLAQGDPWDHVSIHVPRGEGPFHSWDEAAIHALFKAARWQDWSPGGAMTLLEQYNGLGYAAHGQPSPYVWASTNQYMKGKYISDGHYDPHAIDHQLGCAAILKRMATIDDTVNL